jgi:hypothetical protein
MKMAGPHFNLLQNHGSSGDSPHLLRIRFAQVERRDLMNMQLEEQVLKKLNEPIRYSPQLRGSLADLIDSVKRCSHWH